MRKTIVLFILGVAVFAGRINAEAGPVFESLSVVSPDSPVAPPAVPVPSQALGPLGLPPMNPLSEYYKLAQAIVQKVSRDYLY